MKNYIKWWILIVAAAVAIMYLLPQNINVSVNETLDRTQVEAIANEFMKSSGYSLQDYHSTISRDVANFTLVYLSVMFYSHDISPILSLPEFRFPY